jgi:DNA sulfur modification protein DndD
LNGNLKSDNTEFNITFKENNQLEFLPPIDADTRMKEILPSELSKYFFFDGERIEKMSKDITDGKSKEFGEAVRNLLGLSAFTSAIKHLNPRSKYGVIGSYDHAFDSSANAEILRFSSKINKLRKDIIDIDNRIEEIQKQLPSAREQIDNYKKRIEKSKGSKQFILDREELVQQVKKAENLKTPTYNSILSIFNDRAAAHFSRPLIKNVLKKLSEDNKLDKGIPSINSKTIEFLLNRKSCICGTDFVIGDEIYTELNRLLDFIPPKSLGTIIDQFIQEAARRSQGTTNLFNEVSDLLSVAKGLQDEIDSKLSNIQKIEERLLDQEDVAALQRELMRYEKMVKDFEFEKDQKLKSKGAIDTDISRLEAQRSQLTLRDKKNRKIEIYKAYAVEIYKQLTEIYKDKESETRLELEKTINQIFKEIFDGNLSLSIDERYNVTINVTDDDIVNKDVEGSTSQTISVIFAFITGIIKMARDRNSASDEQADLLSSEPYPLVMDAPLSAFDTHRIKNVCEILPNIAEQVIIFIKDTDGDLAEKHLGSKIGKRYSFAKKNELETVIG